MELPPALLHVLADSACDLIAWDGQRQEWVLRGTKDALPETGILRFADVQYVQLAQHLTIEHISIVRPAELGRHPLAAQFLYEACLCCAPRGVEEFPWYLAQQFGKDRVPEELHDLEATRTTEAAWTVAAPRCDIGSNIMPGGA